MICLSIYTLTIAILVSERTSDIFYPLIAPVRRSIIAVSHLMTNSDSFHPLFSGFLSLFPSVKALCDNRIAKAAEIALVLSLTAVKAVNRDNLPPAVNCDNLLLRLCGDHGRCKNKRPARSASLNDASAPASEFQSSMKLLLRSISAILF